MPIVGGYAAATPYAPALACTRPLLPLYTQALSFRQRRAAGARRQAYPAHKGQQPDASPARMPA